MELRAGVILAAIFHFSSGFPVLGLALQMPVGHTFTYGYITRVTFNEPNTVVTSQVKKDVGFILNCKVNLRPVFSKGNHMVVKLSIVTSSLESASNPQKHHNLKSLTRYPILAQWDGTEIRQVYSAERDADWSVNIKKGIISLFQINRENGRKTETDASGECSTTYKVEGLTISKTKTGCVSSRSVGQFSNVQPILAVHVTSAVKSTTTLSKDDVIQTVETEEKHVHRLNIRDNLATSVQATQTLTLEKKGVGATAVQASTADEAIQVVNAREKLKLQGTSLASTYEKQVCSKPDCDKKLSKLVANLRDDLASSNMATTTSGDAFLQLVDALRYSNQTAVTAILSDPENSEIVPQLIDTIAASQTRSGQAALMRFLNFDENYDIKLQERYLLAAAFSTHPHDDLIRDLMALFQKDSTDAVLKESIGDALGAVIYTFSRNEQNKNKEVIKEAEKKVLDKLEGCSDTLCRTTYLRLIGNAGLPDTLGVLLKYAETAEDPTVSSAAIKAMRRLPDKYMSEKVLSVMRKIFFQNRRGYATAVRVEALGVILSHGPSSDTVRAVLEATTDPYDTEFAMYVQQRLFQTAQRDDGIRAKVRKALQDISLGNYHVLAPKGKSLAFKEHMINTASLAGMYDMYVLNSKAGIMKRSGMDVDLSGQNSTMPLYSFGIFAAGLEGMLGEEPEPGQENVDPTAGLALDLLDVALRPVTFFTGQSGLMSAVWNAPSELTNALQANLLLQDHRQVFNLQNGMQVSLNVKGVVSMDLSGLVSISLWNKNCQSLIKNSGAMVIRASLGLHTPAFRTELHHSAEAATVIDFKTDVDFYDTIKMCLQMSRPAFSYRHNVTKVEQARGFKTSFIAKIRRTTKVNAASYPLPKPNNNQCKAMHVES